MKGKGYRSNIAKAVWIVIVHLAAVAAVICAAFFVMLYQTGIRLDDRGKSYIQSEGFRERLNSRGTDILESLSAKEDINYLTNAGSSAVIDLAEFEEKEINRDSLSELSFKNKSGVAYSVKDLLEWAQDWTGVGESYDYGSLDDAGQFIQCKASDGSSYYFSLSDFKKLATDGILKVNYDQDIMEEYDDSYETKFAEKTEASMRFEKGVDTQRVDEGLNLALRLIKEIFPDSKIIKYADVYPNETKKNEIKVSEEFLDTRLGKKIPQEKIEQILTALGYEISLNNGEYDVIVPTWRDRKSVV